VAVTHHHQCVKQVKYRPAPDRADEVPVGGGCAERISAAPLHQPMNDREQKQNDILARCIHCDSSGELHRGEEQITNAEREERCLRRAMWLMALLTALAAVGLGYSVILLYELPPYQTRIINHVLVVVGLASLISLLAFGAFWIQCRHRLSVRREEVRRLVMKLLADQSGTVRDRRNESQTAKAH
jgi:hypothetical protein